MYGLVLSLKSSTCSIGSTVKIESIRIGEVKTISTPDQKKINNLHEFILKKSLEYVHSIPPHSPDAFTSHLVITTSKDARKEIYKKIRQFYNDINKISG